MVRILLVAGAALLAGCTPAGPSREPDGPSNAALDDEVTAVINLQDRTEIAVLKDRVVALEREVGELKANPQALDLDLLTQRVERLEASAAATAATPPPTAPVDTRAAERAVDAAIAERRKTRE